MTEVVTAVQACGRCGGRFWVPDENGGMVCGYCAREPQVPMKRRSVPVVASTPLSPRQVDVLHHLALGRSNREVAMVLGVTMATLKELLKGARDRLRVSDREALIAYAREQKL